MNRLSKSFLKQMQCSLLVALMVFASIGCSVKQNLFGAFDFVVEKPLSGSKAVSGLTSISCSVVSTSEETSGTYASVAKGVLLSFGSQFSNLISVGFDTRVALNKDYILKVVGTDPPLYLMFKKIKVALL